MIVAHLEYLGERHDCRGTYVIFYYHTAQHLVLLALEVLGGEFVTMQPEVVLVRT